MPAPVAAAETFINTSDIGVAESEPGTAPIIAVIVSRRENPEQGKFQRSTTFEINARGRATLNKASADHPELRLPPIAHCSATDCFTPVADERAPSLATGPQNAALQS